MKQHCSSVFFSWAPGPGNPKLRPFRLLFLLATLLSGTIKRCCDSFSSALRALRHGHGVLGTLAPVGHSLVAIGLCVAFRWHQRRLFPVHDARGHGLRTLLQADVRRGSLAALELEHLAHAACTCGFLSADTLASRVIGAFATIPGTTCFAAQRQRTAVALWIRDTSKCEMTRKLGLQRGNRSDLSRFGRQGQRCEEEDSSILHFGGGL